MYYFFSLKPVFCSMSSSSCCFLTCIQVSQEAGQVVWYSHLFQNFPQFLCDPQSKALNIRYILKFISILFDWLIDLFFSFGLSSSEFGEGTGNLLQCSCLENPRDGGAWWAAVSGVAQSRTRLKQLSSSSSGELMGDNEKSKVLTVRDAFKSRCLYYLHLCVC